MSSPAYSLTCNGAHPALHYPERRQRETVERYTFDQDYVERLAGGDAEIGRHFAAYFGELLLIKLRSRLRSQQAVADLRQETFVRVFRALRKKDAIRYPERLGGFVNSVCENVLLEFFRSGKATVQIQEDVSEPVDRSSSVESELITEESAQLVQKILSELSEGDRKIIRGVFLEERNKDQLCEELKIDRNNLRVRVHRALARFRSSYKDKEELARGAAGGSGGPLHGSQIR
ncbi:MAG: sigma-70 family RNA polymerase sigma factor [Bryobacteraceae bacterium]